MELAEEDGIVRIRRRDFTKRRLPMCNSFWRPWNCYCEKFSSCNSSTESPQIGRIQPPYHSTTTTTTPTFLWSMIAWNPLGVWMQRFGFFYCEFCSSQKIFERLWGMDDTSHSLMPLDVQPPNHVKVCRSVGSLISLKNMYSLLLYLATQTVLVSFAVVFRYLLLRLLLLPQMELMVGAHEIKKMTNEEHPRRQPRTAPLQFMSSWVPVSLLSFPVISSLSLSNKGLNCPKR